MGNEKDSIQLTDADVKRLKSGLSELLQLNKQNEEISASEDKTLSEHISEISTSFEEAFPRYGDETVGIFNKANREKIKKAFNLQRESENNETNLNEILERNGLLEGMDIIRKNPELILNPDKDRLNRVINNLDLYLANNLKNTQLLNLIKKNEENYIKINKTNLAENIDLFLEYSKKSIDIFKNNNIYTNLGFGVVSFISITLSYRVLIKSYAHALYGRDNFSYLPEKDRLKAVLDRAKQVRKFSL